MFTCQGRHLPPSLRCERKAMAGKICVTKTIGGEYRMFFEEKDVRKACILQGCKNDLIEGCIAVMKEEGGDCTSCYIGLINEIKSVPEYRKE